MTDRARKAMIVDLLHSCAHPPVARAALASIGGPFAERVRRCAEARDLPAGVFAARAVARFADTASPADRGELAAAMRQSDQPLLAGLRAILAHALAEGRLGAGAATPGGAANRCDAPRLCA
ncbi:MAG: hypothetical protein JNK46_09060 [Methylobacteriaceae bacterium]|nr:hypothetical protein [Methylobacteriaceae bacterium]